VDHFDDVIIGAGQSGPFLAVRLAAKGRRVALVERRRLGGTCINDGCIPTKTLVASARAAYVAREAARWGVAIGGGVSVEFARVKARKDAVVQESRDGLQTWLGSTPNLTLLAGHARFASPTELEVAGHGRVAAERFFLNVGARAIIPPIPGLAGVALTNSGMMELDVLPGHLAIIGGSFVALEFAQMYRRFGSQVTVLERGPRLLPKEDEDAAEVVARVFAREGIAVRTGVEVSAVSRQANGGARLALSQGESVEATHVLVAVGRQPNTKDLGLEAAGVATDARGYVTVDGGLRTNVPHIYALGDANGRGAFTHTSYNDFEVLAANLLDGASRSIDGRLFIANVYVDPPLGRVGMSEREARASGRRVLKGFRPMTQVGRARERGETEGFIKVLVDADTRQLLGATIVGVEGDEAIHALAAAMTAGASSTVLQHAVFAHPTVSELIPTVLGSLLPLT
jgi:pyruvate/2-oxoglutarate dehydrogenase complex dihydrolipoamide dehydrogenase (E3) component